MEGKFTELSHRKRRNRNLFFFSCVCVSVCVCVLAFELAEIYVSVGMRGKIVWGIVRVTEQLASGSYKTTDYR